jgi:hypothetical protein
MMALYDAMTGTGLLSFAHFSKIKVRLKLIIFQMYQRLVGRRIRTKSMASLLIVECISGSAALQLVV